MSPGSTTNCQTIDHIQVDTGSYGLRILAPVLTVALPVQTLTNGASLVECTAFVDGYSWGPVALADVQISGETAASVPVQIIGDPDFTTVPQNCSDVGPAEDTVAAFGANGILGIGVLAQDCGAICETNIDNGVYYACTSTLCQPTTASLTDQVPNPVTLFATDNNGVIIQLPSVAAQGATTVTGTMIFGIDTQTNNKSGTQSVLTVDSIQGDFTTIFQDQQLNQSFLDTGSNGLYFTDDGLAQCTSTGLAGFYCPVSTQSFTATLQGLNGVSAGVSFDIANANTLGADNAALVAFATLGGTYSSSADTFDWGLPFFLWAHGIHGVRERNHRRRDGTLRRLLIRAYPALERQDRLPVNDYQADIYGDHGSQHGRPTARLLVLRPSGITVPCMVAECLGGRGVREITGHRRWQRSRHRQHDPGAGRDRRSLRGLASRGTFD